MIEYIFKMADGEVFQFEVDLERSNGPVTDPVATAPWTALDYYQCPNCPLTNQTHRCCPAAVDIESITSKFNQMLSSNQEVEVIVRTPERAYFKQCDVQTGLRALLGLVMASSACPVLARLKGLTYYHLPFATSDETLFRSVSAYLLKQYFIFKDGGEPDLNLIGLSQLYDELYRVNSTFGQRLQSASESETNLNAIVSLMYLGASVSFSLEDKLRELRPRFLQGE